MIEIPGYPSHLVTLATETRSAMQATYQYLQTVIHPRIKQALTRRAQKAGRTLATEIHLTLAAALAMPGTVTRETPPAGSFKRAKTGRSN
jgi:hypothetical protein